MVTGASGRPSKRGRIWMAAALAVFGTMMAHAAEFSAGPIKITAVWTMATPERAAVAGGFLTLTNTGRSSDRLVSATTEASGRVDIHAMHTVNGVMMMRDHGEGLELKPGQTVTLKPFSHHLMLLELKQPLVAGQTLKGTLTFEKAGTVDIVYSVEPIGAKGPGAQGKSP